MLFPDAREILKWLKEKGIKIAIATGMSIEPLRLILQTNGLDKLADAVVNGDEVKRSKPAPDIFLEAFKRLKIKPASGLVVGDTENDVLAGKAAGAYSVLIERTGRKGTSVADSRIRSLTELKSILQ